MMEKAKPFRVLVIGGGNAGLALAQGLKKANIAYTVFDRDSEDVFNNKTRDWGMLLHWAGKYLQEMLPPDMQERIKEPEVDNFYTWSSDGPVNVNGKTGDVILRVPVDDPIVRVSRKKLRKFLSEGLDIRCDKKLRTVKTEGDTVTAIFDDGTSETGNMLIGADGSRSKVRQFLVGDEAAKPQLLPFTFINYSNGKYTAEQAKLLRTVHPIVKLGYHPENQGLSLLAVLDNPDPTKPELTKFQILQSWRGPPYANELSDDRERLKYFKYRAGQFCEPFRTAALALGDESVLPINQGQQWKPIWWDNRGGKVTLVGDAAHSMLPHRGQGLNNAILDSAEIVNAVKAALFDGKNLKEEIDKYEAEMRPRATKEVELALQTAEMSADWEKFTESPLFKLGHNKDKM